MGVSLGSIAYLRHLVDFMALFLDNPPPTPAMTAATSTTTTYLEPYVPRNGPSTWVGLAALPTDAVLDAATALKMKDFKDAKVVTVPGVTVGREGYHITVLYGFEADLIEQACKLVREARITQDDVVFGAVRAVQSPGLKATGTWVIIVDVKCPKLEAQRKELREKIPYVNPRYVYDMHMELLFLQGPVPTTADASV